MRLAERSRRRGAVLAVVIVALIALTVLAAGLLKMALAQRQIVQMDERRYQADWLAESGLERASARLAKSADYKGETWTVPASELGGSGEGVVTIAVEPVEGKPERRLVKVRADYPREATRSARRSKQWVVEKSPQSGNTP